MPTIRHSHPTQGNHSTIKIEDSEIFDRERLGIVVRALFMQWAENQSNPKASWKVPWIHLSDEEKEVDRRIGEVLFRAGAEWIMMQSSKMSIEPSPDFKLFLELLPEDGSLPGETLENSSGGISQEEFYENHPELDGADEIKKRK